MDFAPTSRYKVDTGNITASRKTLVAVPYFTHRVIEGDTLMNLSARHLRSDRRWWEIADLNPQVKYPEDLVVGNIIRIPQ